MFVSTSCNNILLSVNNHVTGVQHNIVQACFINWEQNLSVFTVYPAQKII